MKDSVYTSLSSVQVLNQTPLAKTFNRESLEKELQIQVEVSQAFSQNVASARHLLNHRKAEYEAAFKRGELSKKAYEDKVAMLDSVGLGLSVLSAGLSSPSEHAAGIAAASLSPLAAYQIGQYAKAHKMEGSAPHVIAHAVLAGAVAAAGGQDMVSSAVAAGGAELLAPVLSQYLYDKPSSELSVEEKQSLSAILRLAGAGVGASAGGSNLIQTAQAVDGAVENNYLTADSLARVKDCLTGKTCYTDAQKLEQLQESEKLSQFLDKELDKLCKSNPLSDACRTGVNTAIAYISMKDAWAYMNHDVKRVSKNTFDYLYNQKDSKKLFSKYLNTIDTRADFFAASNLYEQHVGSSAKWFEGADFVSRAFLTGLGADGNLSHITFALGKTLGNPPLYEWRKEAGSVLMNGGFENFKDLYNNPQNPVEWDIGQLREEQMLLQPIHEKYLAEYDLFRLISKSVTSETVLSDILFFDKRKTQQGGIDLLDYKSRVRYGCKLLGYTRQQGCTP